MLRKLTTQVVIGLIGLAIAAVTISFFILTIATTILLLKGFGL